MSRFDDDVRVDLRGIYADAGDIADYQGASTAPGILVVIDRDWQVYDKDQLPMRVTTISVMSADVPQSEQGDQINVASDRTWTVQEVLEDDGHERRLWVS
ncbi:hypothetical protein QWY79_10225 [Halomonas sabkhae]|uniref:head-tail joining protein n=1 Tax=Halomonas sabkhae TaxID=626223 RepID=UPI0025B4067E|nr:hypothetical protein [Halomonas sabkhae]MDN3525640.1 hypothetical protein [Halomonas sabkhae]